MKAFLMRHFSTLWMFKVYLFLYLPLLFMVVFSFNSTRQDANFTGFSLRWYEALMRDTKIVEGFWLSIQVATVTGLLSATLGTLAAFVLVRYRKFLGRTVFSGMVNAPLVMPEVVIGLSLLLLMVGAQNVLGWPESTHDHQNAGGLSPIQHSLAAPPGQNTSTTTDTYITDEPPPPSRALAYASHAPPTPRNSPQ